MKNDLKISNLGSSQLSREELAHVKGGDFWDKALEWGNKAVSKLPIKPSIGGSTATQLLRHAVFPPPANAPTLDDYNSGVRY